MTSSAPGGTLTLAGDFVISRMGFGAMQLAGPRVFGPPRDRDQALAVLREAVDRGVTHIDTSDFYGPVTVNELIREALHPYPADLRIVTKVGARRGEDGSWRPSHDPPTSRPRSGRTSRTSAWTPSTPSTCGSGPMAPAGSPSPSRSAPWPNSRRRA